MNSVHHPAKEYSVVVSSSIRTLSPHCRPIAQGGGHPLTARHACSHSAGLGTDGAPKGIAALRGTKCGSVQHRRLSCSGSAAIPAIVLSVGMGSGSGDRLHTSGSRRLPAHKASDYSPVVAGRASIKAALPNPSLKRTHNGIAVWPSSAGASPHFALAVQPAMPLRAA